MKLAFDPERMKLLTGCLNGGFKRGELVTIVALQTPRPFSRETVEFLEGTLARSKEAKLNA